MNILNKIVRKPPFKCIFCNSNENSFSSVEHIIPHSLGNNFLILDKGWVCDKCNNLFSSFEAKVINHTFYGAERAFLGVITKKGKPARSKFGKLHWNARPGEPRGTFQIDEKDLDKHPFLKMCWDNGKLIIPFHSKYDYLIAKFLLKIGIESKYINIKMDYLDFLEAKEYVINKSNDPWPYVMVQTPNVSDVLGSVFSSSKYIHSYALSSGFDIFLLDVHGYDSIVLFFKYGHSLCGINLSSRSLNWIEYLKKAQVNFVCCPLNFVEFSN